MLGNGQSSGRRSVRHQAQWWIIAVAVVARIPLLFVGLTYRIDIWRQTDTASIAHNFTHDANLFFPRINWGGAGPGFVESELQLFPWTVSWLYRLFGEHVWLGRSVALACTAGTLVMLWKLAEQLLPRRAALVALVCFACMPVFVRYSTAFMPEALALLGYVSALVYFDRWFRTPEWRWALLCGAWGGLAALVKPTSLHIGIVFAIALVVVRGWRGVFTRQAVAIAALVAAPAALWMWHAAGLHHRYGNTFGVISGGDRKFGGLSTWLSTAFYVDTGRIDGRWVFVWVGVVPAVLGVGVAVARRAPVLLLGGVGGLVVYYLVAARYIAADFGVQYHVYTAVFAALAMGLGTDWLVARLGGRPLGVIAVVPVLAVVAGGVMAWADQFPQRADDVVACGHFVRQVVPVGDLIIVSSTSPQLDHGVENNFQDPTVFYYAQRNGWSMAADHHEPALVAQWQQQGARWLVISPAMLDAHPALRSAVNVAQRVPPPQGRPAPSCDVYRLSP